MAKRVPRTRNGGTQTESMYWGMIRSALRTIWIRHWQPRKDALNAAKRQYKGTNKRRKWEYKCAISGKYYPLNKVEVDHKKGNLSLRCKEDIIQFIESLLTEDVNELQVISKVEHKMKTNRERKSRKK
jgi:hypothetical protein